LVGVLWAADSCVFSLGVDKEDTDSRLLLPMKKVSLTICMIFLYSFLAEAQIPTPQGSRGGRVGATVPRGFLRHAEPGSALPNQPSGGAKTRP
jgi:hypothetical protein